MTNGDGLAMTGRGRCPEGHLFCLCEAQYCRSDALEGMKNLDTLAEYG